MSAPMAERLRDAKLLFSSKFQEGVQALRSGVDTTWEQKAEKIPTPGTEVAVFGFLTEMPLFKKWTGERTTKRLKTGSYSIRNEDYEYSYSIGKNDVKYDKFGLLAQHPRGGGLAQTRFYDDEVNTAQANGSSSTCFDGQYFYDTDHPEGLDGSGSTFSNRHTSMALTAANIQTRYQYGAAIKDANGKRFGVRYNILEFGPAHIIDVFGIMNADIVALAASSAPSNAGISNSLGAFLKQMGITPVLNNELDGKWYMHDTRFMKPFIVTEETPPTGLIARENPEDPDVWNHKEFNYGADATAGFGYGLPQLTVECVE